MQERDYYLGFSLISGIGPKTFKALLNEFKTAKNAWNATSNELKIAGFSSRIIQKLEKAKNEFDFLVYKKLLKSKKAFFVALCDNNYPNLLKAIPNPPIVLFIKSFWETQEKEVNLNDYSKAVGIVGTRKITNYGRVVTEMFAKDLAFNGFTVVSGLAMGVDAVSSWSAIDANGKTIVVLGNGVDLCFPSSNEKLYDKILENNGIIVSEFPIGQAPTLGSFPSRNRIIAGLSLGVLVTEGAEDSGSLITADYAFKFGRKVFAVPGPITSQLSVAPLRLIEKGARLVTSASDINRELNVKSLRLKVKSQNQKLIGLSKEELEIVNVLENESLGFDAIVRKTGINAPSLSTLLSMLEIKGVVGQSAGNYSILR